MNAKICAVLSLTFLAGNSFCQTAGPSQTVSITNALGLVTNVPASALDAMNPVAMATNTYTPPEIRIDSGGALAEYGPLIARFTPSVSESRPITVSTLRGGRSLAFRPTYLALVKRSTGEAWILGQVTNSVLEVAGSEVLYSQAFDTISADIKYVYSGSRLEQFLTIKENFDLPNELKGCEDDLDLEAWTQCFFDNQALSIQETVVLLRPAQSGLPAVEAQDQSTDFGYLKIPGGGKAFNIGDEDDTIPVAKTFVRLEADGSPDQAQPAPCFLCERTDWISIKAKLANLPKHPGQASLQYRKTTRARLARLSPPPPAPASSAAVLLARKSSAKAGGVVIDFAVAAPPGLIAWWKGEENNVETVAGLQSTVNGGMGYAAAEVGQGFNLDGNDDWVSVNPVPILNFTEGVDFSIEGWINPLSASTDYGVQMIADKRDTTASDEGAVGYALYLVYGQLGCQITEGPLVSGHYHAYGPAGADLRNATTNHHVAMTIHRNSASGGKLYVDGIEVLSFPTTNFNGDLSSGSPLRVGKHATSWVNAPFKGLIDELSIYNRALSQAEVQSIYSAGADGKALPPTITTQPQSQTVPLGANVTFTVAATGTAPLSYQWRFNTVNISGATGTSYTRNNVQPGDAGSYSVVVSNPGGSSTSADAILTVTGGGACTLVPSGLVSWWRAEGDAADASCLNPGTLMNGATFGAGQVGQGFSLNGASRYARVPSSASLRLTQELTIECWYKDTGATAWYGLIAKRIANSPETTSYGINIFPTGPNQVVQFYFRPAGANWQICSVPSVPAPNVFHHIAGTFRQTDSTHVEAKLFIDGSPVKTSTLIGNLADCQNDAPVTIGASYESGEYLVGVIDEASIYNRALSETEIQNLYTAGAAGKCLDSDGDGLPDAWEMRYFGNLLQPASGDPDGDGLTNAEEYLLGYDPTNANTGGSLLADGQKDYDHDGLSNLEELRTYNSNPANPNTFSSLTDAEYFLSAPIQLEGYPPPALSKAKGLYRLSNGLLLFTITEADPGAQFDLYFTSDVEDYDLDRRWRWRRFYSGIVCDGAGAATFTVKPSTEPSGFFIVLRAEDSDGDGLTDGYECFFRYNGIPTMKGNGDTDGDGLNDGWEVQYGLDPTDDGHINPINGAAGNPDEDAYLNSNPNGNPTYGEYELYSAGGASSWNASYDPFKSFVNNTCPSCRAVVTITASTATTLSDVGSFTITRQVGNGGSMSGCLDVYYSIGGSLVYENAEYSVDPQPPRPGDPNTCNGVPPYPPYTDGYPRVFIATIPANQPSVTVWVKLGQNTSIQGTKTVTATITPFGVGASPQVGPDQSNWAYVVDWRHNRATVTFGQNPLEVPAVGTAYMRITSTKVLELVRIMASTDPTWASYVTPANRPATTWFEVASGGPPQTPSSVGFRRRPIYESYPDTSDIRIENALVLTLDTGITDNTAVEVHKAGTGWDQAAWPTSLRFIARSHPLRYSPAIHVNQDGYLATSPGTFPKKAKVGYYLGDLGEMQLSPIPNFHLVDAVTGQTISDPNASGTLVLTPDDVNTWNPGDAEYQHVMEADFSNFTAPGQYQLQVDGLGVSLPFWINDATAMKWARTYALGLYHQRCGSGSGVDYTGGTGLPITALSGSGTGATITPTIINGIVAGGTIVTGGLGWNMGDTFTFADATGTGFIGTVVTVAGGPPGPLATFTVHQVNDLPFTRFTHGNCHAQPVFLPRYDANDPANDYPDAQTVNTHNDLLTRYANDNPNLEQQAQRLTDFNKSLYPFVNNGAKQAILGHHDAGDYSKYVINSALLIHILVFGADNFPGAATLDNLAVPESGDTKSDVLQEAKWEADFLIKMQDNTGGANDGAFHFLLYPQDGAYEFSTPDRGPKQVFYPKTTSVTAAAVAALAEIGSSPKFLQQFGLPAPTSANLYPNVYLQAARKGWQFLEGVLGSSDQNLNTTYQKITHYGDDFAHRDELAWAAAALFAATGNSEYSTKLMSRFGNPANPLTWRFGWQHVFAGWGCAIRDYSFFQRSATGLTRYQQLVNGGITPVVNGTYLTSCDDEIKAAGSDWRNWSKKDDNTGQNAYGTSLSSHDKQFGQPGWYFSTDPAFDIAVADLVQHAARNINAIVANLNYQHGCNPLNVAFVTGVGSKRQHVTVNQYQNYPNYDTRMLPPSGIPLGNISFEITTELNKPDLNPYFYPPSAGFGSGPTSFLLYDRWADAHNVSAEFVCLQSARALVTTAYLNHLSGASAQTEGQQWRAAMGTIVPVPSSPTPSLGAAQVLQLTCSNPNIDLSTAQILWDGEGQDRPTIGPTVTLTPRGRAGQTLVEAEAVLPDGRRVFARTYVQINDSVKGGTESTPDPTTTAALYHFNGTFNDETTHQYNFTAYGAAMLGPNISWMGGTPAGQSARFSGLGDSIDVENISDANLRGGGGFRLECWMYPKRFPAPDGDAHLLHLWQNHDSSLEWSIYYRVDLAAVPLFYVGPNRVPGFNEPEWNTYMSLNTWHHIAITFYQTGPGAPKTTLEIDGHTWTSSGGPALGTANWALSFGDFVGDIDEVRLTKLSQ